MITFRPNAQRIRELREEAGLTQEDVSTALGVRPETVGRAEDSSPRRRIQRDILESMAALFTRILKRPVSVEDITLPDGPPPDSENQWAHTALLIPAAGPPPGGLRTTLGVDTVLMVSVARHPIIYWNLSYARRLGIKHVRIAVQRLEIVAEVEAYVKLVFSDLNVDVFVPDDVDRGPGYTMTTLFRRLCTPAPPPGIDAALVVLGDTAFEFAVPPGPPTRTPLSTSRTCQWRQWRLPRQNPWSPRQTMAVPLGP
jgi:transcriptional regulator with XRE-family HTH domain